MTYLDTETPMSSLPTFQEQASSRTDGLYLMQVRMMMTPQPAQPPLPPPSLALQAPKRMPDVLVLLGHRSGMICWQRRGRMNLSGQMQLMWHVPLKRCSLQLRSSKLLS